MVGGDNESWNLVYLDDTINTVERVEEYNEVGVKRYVITIRSLANDFFESGKDLYSKYSGNVQVTINSGFVEDKSGNQNQTTTIAIQNNDQYDEVDFVNPNWRVENATVYNANTAEETSGETSENDSYVIMDLIGSDKYLDIEKSSLLSVDDIEVFIKGENEDKEIKSIKKEIISGPTYLTEQRNGTDFKYGMKYKIKISGFKESEKHDEKGYYDWSGWTYLRIKAGKLVDLDGNVSKQQEVLTKNGIIDFIRPDIVETSLTAEEVYNDKTSNGTQKTIRFKVYDKYEIQEFTQEEIENMRQKIQVYIDGLSSSVTKNLTYINGEFRIIITGMSEGTSGEIKIKIPKNIVFDQYKNGNAEKTITAITDNTKPVIIYENSKLDIENKTYTMTIRTFDRYYNDENRIINSNINAIIIDGEEIKEKIDVKIETDEKNDAIKQTLNGENVITGRRYKIIFSNMDQGDGKDYSGVLSLTISEGAVRDKYLNESLETTIVSGVYSADDEPEEVDTVSPGIESTGVRTYGNNIRLTLKVSDKIGIDKKASSMINSSKNEIIISKIQETIGETIEEVEATYVANSFTEQTDSNGNITEITFQIDIPKLDETKLDETGSSSVYVKIEKGLISDKSGNVNKEIQIALSTELMCVSNETTADSPFLGSSVVKRKNVESIQFVYGIPEEAIVEATGWDVSKNQDMSILAWYTTNMIQTSKGTEITYNVFIGSDFTINANKDSSYLFANIATSENCSSTTVLRNMYLLRTSRVVNMSHMFENCGANIMMELELGANFSVSKVTNMEKMFYGSGATTMNVLDLGARFVKIAENNSDMLTNCGNTGCMIYVGEAIYKNEHALRVKNNNTTIGYTQGTIECKYKTEWAKVESLLMKEDKSLMVTIQATEPGYICKKMQLDASDIKVYVDEVEAKSIEVEIDEESKIIVDGIAQCSIYLRNFEEEVRQAGKNFKEWSGNIKLVIKKETVFDEYGNGNFENTIVDEKVNKNTTNKMFVDILRPEITYISNLTKQYKEESRLEVKFEMNDKYYDSQELKLSDLQFSVYNETTYEYDDVNINVSNNILSAEESTTGVMYTLTINNLPNGSNGKYIGSSGYVTILIPEGKVRDKSNNTNMEQVITIGIDSDDETGEAEIVDVVDPEWRVENVKLDRETLTITADIIGTDKYFKASTLKTKDISVYISKSQLGAEVVLSEGTELKEIRNGKSIVYGMKYAVTVTVDKSNLGKSGYVKLIINSGILIDKYGNYSKETELKTGYIDLKEPAIEKVSSNIDKNKKTEQIVFKITDENFKECTVTTDDINVYVDGKLANSINKTILESELYDNDENGDRYRSGTLYTLTLLDFANTNKINSEKIYQDWSGNVSIRIKEQVAEDYAENKSQQTIIEGDFVDFVSPSVQYSYLTADIDKVEKNATIKFSILDKYYSSGTLSLSDLTILIDEEEPDWTKVEKSLRVEDMNITEDGETRKIGNTYTIIISNLIQGEKGEDRNTLDYSGVITVLIPAGKIVDGSENKNKAETIVIGMSQNNISGITSYTSKGTTTGTTTDQNFSIEGSYDTQSANGWKIIGVTEDGKLMLVATDVVLPKGSDGYKLNGAEGYENADDELNRISALYGQGYGAINARSITLDDINKIIKYSAISETKTYNASNVRNNEFHFFDETENKWSVIKMFVTNVNKVIKNTFYEYTASSVSSKEQQVIFGNKSYWIANNSTKTDSDMVRYGVFYINNDTLSAKELYNSQGESTEEKNGVKPIVTLDENVKLVGSSDSMWDIVEEKDAYEIIVDLNGTTYADGDSVKTFKLKPGEKWEMKIPEKTNNSVESITVEYGKGTSVIEKDNGKWSVTMGTEKAKIVVNWELNKYKVTFNANGGVVNPEAISRITHGTSITLPIPTKEGYTFLGWTQDSSAIKADDGLTAGASYTVLKNQTLYAVWQRNQYTVTFVSSTGFTSQNVTVIDTTGDTSSNVANYTGTKTLPQISLLYNMTIKNIPNAKEKKGYTFKGWSENENSEVADYTTQYKALVRNVTLYAVFGPNEYTITFDPKEGSIRQNTITGKYNSTIKLPEATLNGYKLAGWSTSSSATVPDSGLEDGKDYLVKGDITLYAVWRRNEYTITFAKYVHTLGKTTTVTDDTGDTSSYVSSYKGNKTLTSTKISGIEIYTITTLYGMKITLPTISAETGLKVLGWSKDPQATNADSGLTVGAEYRVKSNDILYPVFECISYKLTINGNGGTINPSQITQTHKIRKNQVKIQGGTATVITEKDTVLTPGSGSTNQSTFAINCYYGDTIVLPSVNEKTGYYTATGYSTTSNATSHSYAVGTTYTVTGNQTLYATPWKKKSYTVTYNTNGGSMANGESKTRTELYNTEITLSSASKTGYNFQGWSLTQNSIKVDYSAGASYTINKNVTLYAVYTVCQYVITFSASGGNITNPYTNLKVGATYTVTVNYGDNVKLPSSVEYTGYTFKNWKYAGKEYSGGSTYRVTGNVTFQATRTANRYTYNFYFNSNYNSESYIIYNGQKIYVQYTNPLTIEVEYGTKFNLPTAANTGYVFNGWNENSNVFYGMNGEYSVNQTNNKNFYGIWTHTVYTITLDGNGGSCSPGTVIGHYGDTVNLPTPTRTDYNFRGWSTSSNAANGTIGNYTITGNISLYATWESSKEEVNLSTSINSAPPIETGYFLSDQKDLNGNKYIAKITGTYKGGMEKMMLDRTFQFKIEGYNGSSWVILWEKIADKWTWNFGKARYSSGSINQDVNGNYSSIRGSFGWIQLENGWKLVPNVQSFEMKLILEYR